MAGKNPKARETAAKPAASQRASEGPAAAGGRSVGGRPRGETYARTLKEAAAKLGVPVDLLRMARAAGCKAFKSSGRVCIVEAAQFLADNPHLASASSDASDASAMVSSVRESALDKKAIREMREHKLALLRREVIPATEMRLTFTRAFLETKKKFSESFRTLAQEIGLHMAGTEDQIAWALNLSERRARETLLDLSKNEWLATCPKCGEKLS